MDNVTPWRSFPEILNLGCGLDFREECLNIDRDENVISDAVLDLGKRHIGENGLWLDTERFGRIRLAPECFGQIIAHNVLQQVSDLPRLLDICLELLKEGGTVDIVVPYDLSYGAWSDPANLRGFNEVSFQRYAIDPDTRTGKEPFFAVAAMNYIPGPLGRKLGEAGMPVDEVSRQPRAIDALTVTLQKIGSSGKARKSTGAGNSLPAVAASANPALRPFPDGWSGHKNRHCIWVVTPEGYIHSQAFAEAAFTLECAFTELGGSAPVVKNLKDWNGRIPIVYGGNLLPIEAINVLPKGSIIINLEQVSPESTWMTGRYAQIMKAFAVFDYSERNRRGLIEAGITHAETLDVGYSTKLTRIPHAPVKDIDVLFYGSINAERAHIIEGLKARGLNVVHLFGIYGAERDKSIARAKVVLNMHLYRSAIFEIIRVSYLLANSACVLTEGDVNDPDIRPYLEGMAVTTYDGLVERCVELVQDEEERQAIAESGFRIMSSRSQTDFLMQAMSRSVVPA